MTSGFHVSSRERSLTALVLVEALELFFVGPLSVRIHVPFIVIGSIMIANVAVVLAVVWHIRPAVIAVALAAALEFAATVLRFAHPTPGTQVLDFAAALTLLVALSVVLGYAVFGPGRVTVHRILGAIAIYLNVAAAFALAYRMVDALGTGTFSSGIAGVSGHSLADLISFSFSALTTNSFGVIIPIDPFARSLANLESVIGQLFPATLLARLITLELEHRRGIT